MKPIHINRTVALPDTAEVTQVIEHWKLRASRVRDTFTVVITATTSNCPSYSFKLRLVDCQMWEDSWAGGTAMAHRDGHSLRFEINGFLADI